MTLDEIESMARILAHDFDNWNASHADASVDLARAVLAMLPVVRAAEGLRPLLPSTRSSNRWPIEEGALADAVDTMRAAIGERL